MLFVLFCADFVLFVLFVLAFVLFCADFLVRPTLASRFLKNEKSVSVR